MKLNKLAQLHCLADFKAAAKNAIPSFAFDYIEEGCNQNCAIITNRQALDAIYLQPSYLTAYQAPNLAVNLFGKDYASPIGIAPVGLSGLIWPQASIHHAQAAKAANIPFVLSTVATISIEQAAAAAGDQFWFQLYPPADREICLDLMQRAAAVGCKNLVVTVDVPTPSRRIKALKSGLSVPPKISLANILQAAKCPTWSWATLTNGLPQFANLVPYMEGKVDNLADAAEFIRLTMRDVVDVNYLQWIREHWQGKLIVKGVMSVADAQLALSVGADGLVISNHGGRQLDAAQSPVSVLPAIRQKLGADAVLIADSGIESGVDVARYLALGADSVLLGRAFMYAVAAGQQAGVAHCMAMLDAELQQVMSQLHCPNPQQLVNFLGS